MGHNSTQQNQVILGIIEKVNSLQPPQRRPKPVRLKAMDEKQTTEEMPPAWTARPRIYLERLQKWLDSDGKGDFPPWFVSHAIRDLVDAHEIMASLRRQLKQALRDKRKDGEMTFRKKLEHLINEESMENGSDTPDFILAEYMESCLQAFDRASKARQNWYRPEGEDTPEETPQTSETSDAPDAS